MVPLVCDCCGAPASVHVMQVSNRGVVRLYFCIACAQKKGFVDETGSPVHSSAPQNSPTPELLPVVCPHCGWEITQLLKSRRVGCGRCYEVFRQIVDLILQRLQGSLCHCGKRAGSSRPKSIPANATPQGRGRRRGRSAAPDKVKELQGFLRLAVAMEDYEKAAAIRDRLAAVRRKKKSSRTSKLSQQSCP